MKSKGLGDDIAKITHFFGIDKVADAVAKLAGLEGCGCEERKQYLNELFPYEDSTRLFKVLQDFNMNQDEYRQHEVIKIHKNHPLYPHTIFLVEDNKLEEIIK